MVRKARRSLLPGWSHPAWPLGIVGLALFLRLAYVTAAPPGGQFANVDARGYHQLAVNLLSRGGFSTSAGPPFYPDHVRAPLYPLFVALVYSLAGPAPLAVVLLQAVLDAVTAAVTFRLGREVGGRRVGLLAAFLYAANPSSWRFCNELLTEILFGLLLSASLWMLVRYVLAHRQRDMLLFGLFMGAATLCKPNIQFIPLLLLAVLLYKRLGGQRAWWQGTALAALTIGAMLFPWLARNRLVFGRWFLTTAFEYNLSLVSAVGTLAHARGESVAPWTPRWWAIYEEIYAQARQQAGGEVCDPLRSICQREIPLQRVTAVATGIIRQHPLDFLASHVEGWLRSFVPQEHRFWYGRLSGVSWSALPLESDALGSALQAARQGRLWAAVRILVEKRLLALPPLALALWSGWGAGSVCAAVLFCAGVLGVRPRVLALILAGAVFYLTFLPGPISHVRFRLPVVPVIAVLVAAGAFSVRGGRASCLAGKSAIQSVTQGGRSA